MSFSIRAATKADLPQIRDIFEHYVLNTVLSFLVQPPTLDYVASRYQDTLDRQLPYIVATDDSADGRVTGYASASAYRGYMLGYGHTVELTLFCRPDYTGQGIGTRLITELIGLLRQTKHVTNESDYESHQVEFDIRKVLAVMAVDTASLGYGLTLRDWYLKFGFEEVGRLKEVGWKKEKWHVNQVSSAVSDHDSLTEIALTLSYSNCILNSSWQKVQGTNRCDRATCVAGLDVWWL